jgi:hypothetical protein
VTHPRLRPEPLDARAIEQARAIAADWRATGLEVDLSERPSPAGGRDGYVLTARSPTRVLRCECRGWRLAPRWPRAAPGPPVWTVEVAVGHRREPEPDGPAGEGALRRAGVALAGAHERAWRRVLDWVDGGAALPASLEAALAEGASGTAPLPPSRRRRTAAVLAAAALALGGAAAYGAWRAAWRAAATAPGATAAPAGGGRWALASEYASRAGPFALQLASVRRPEGVAEAWRRLSARFPAELAGLEPRPGRAVRVPGRGVFHPLLAGAFATRAEAMAACDRLRAAGGECLVVAPRGPAR